MRREKRVEDVRELVRDGDGMGRAGASCDGVEWQYVALEAVQAPSKRLQAGGEELAVVPGVRAE
jgi:hypothetical protein